MRSEAAASGMRAPQDRTGGGGLRSPPVPRASLLAAIVAVLTALALPAAESPAATDCANATVAPTAKNRTAAAKALRCLIQAARADRRLPALTPNKALQRAADRFALQMGSKRFFSHTSPNGDTVCKRIRAAGYPAGAQVSEALGWGLKSSATPKELLRTLMSDAPHRAILLSRSLKDIGVGLAAEPPIKGEREKGATAVVDIARKGKAKAGGTVRCSR